jgi:hypothetical protein
VASQVSVLRWAWVASLVLVVPRAWAATASLVSVHLWFRLLLRLGQRWQVRFGLHLWLRQQRHLRLSCSSGLGSGGTSGFGTSSRRRVTYTLYAVVLCIYIKRQVTITRQKRKYISFQSEIFRTLILIYFVSVEYISGSNSIQFYL